MRSRRDSDLEGRVGGMVIMVGDSFTLGNTVIKNRDEDPRIFTKGGPKR